MHRVLSWQSRNKLSPTNSPPICLRSRMGRWRRTSPPTWLFSPHGSGRCVRFLFSSFPPRAQQKPVERLAERILSAKQQDAGSGRERVGVADNGLTSRREV